MIKLAFGIPAYGGHVVMQQIQMWASIGAALIKGPYPFAAPSPIITIDRNGVQIARNKLMVEAIDRGADWLVMIDADTWVEEDRAGLDPGTAILRMIDAAIGAKIAVVSAPVRLRSGMGLAAFIDGRYLGPSVLLDSKQGPLVSVDAVGAACLAVNLQAVIDANAAFEFTPTLSEDQEFCRQMRTAGQRIAVDRRVRTGHLSKPTPLYSE